MSQPLTLDPRPQGPLLRFVPESVEGHGAPPASRPVRPGRVQSDRRAHRPRGRGIPPGSRLLLPAVFDDPADLARPWGHAVLAVDARRVWHRPWGSRSCFRPRHADGTPSHRTGARGAACRRHPVRSGPAPPAGTGRRHGSSWSGRQPITRHGPGPVRGPCTHRRWQSWRNSRAEAFASASGWRRR